MKLGLGERLFLAHFLLAVVTVGAIFLGVRNLPLLAFGGLAFVGVVGFGYAYSAGRSMRDLQSAVERIAAGDMSRAQLPRGPGELGEVATSLDRVSRQLTSQIETVTSERDLREAVLSGMEDAILVLRPDASLLLYNQAAKELFGLSSKAKEQPLFEFIRFPALLDAVYDATRGRPAPIDLVIPGPPRREVVGRATPLPKGREAAVVIAARDVTELRRLEAMRRDFVSSASHELRTPVSAIRGLADTLAGGALDDPEAAKKFVAGLSRQAERLSDLIEDLLDLTRAESGKAHLSPASLRLGPAVDAVLDLQQDALEAKALKVQRDLPEGTDAFVDPNALDIILGNLVENAIKYSPEGGTILIRAAREGSIVRLEVKDDGPGIEPHHLPRIFERFYRVDPGRARGVGGTGLGLSISKHVAQQCGGDLSVESRPGKGSRFILRIPAGSAA